MDIQSLLLQREWGKFVILSMVYESIGHKERNIWSQEHISRFLEHLLLGLCTEREFRKPTPVNYSTFIFLCERLGPYLKNWTPVLKNYTGAREYCNVIA